MLERQIADCFWRNVSLSLDHPSEFTRGVCEVQAVDLFQELVRQCDGGKNCPVEMAKDFIYFTTNQKGQSFDVSETLPCDLYQRGIQLVTRGASAYYS